MNDPSTSPSTGATEPPASERPLPTFDALPLSAELRETLAEMGYVNPTPVQLAVWEPVTRGKDAVVQARTGTGKTAAFGIPIVDHFIKRSVNAVQALCICPTRELALQVSAEIERLGKRKAIKVAAIYGGAPMPRQVEQLAGGAQVVVGTPGRMLDHLRRGTLDPKQIRLLVLDESDEMLSMGFERELTAILDQLPPDRQTLLFSATLPPDIERIARNKLKQPEFVTLSGDHVGALSILHYVYMVAGDKLGALNRVIEVENPESAVVFCNTKDDTERVAQSLAKQGFDADWLNGDLPQSEREKVMAATREGKLRFLVATDVAARGIDISHLTHVINYDFPQDAEAYVHRTGRTGRMGRTGTAVSLITPRDIGGLYILRLTYKIRPIERQIPTPGELKTRAEADLVSMLVEAFLAKRPHPEDLALARRLLSHDRCDEIVAGLLRDHLGARPTAQDEASAARRAQPPRRIPTRDERWRASKEAERVSTAARTATATPLSATPGPLPTSEPTTSASASRAGELAVAMPARAPAAIESADGGRPARRPRSPRAAEPREPRAAEPREPRAAEPREPRAAEPREPRAAEPHEPRAQEEPRERRDRDEDRRPRGGERGRAEPVAGRGAPSMPRPSGPRHTDFATWQPPEEEGDDQPILRGAGAESASAQSPSAAPSLDADYVEIFVNVGRRDGARAADLQKALVERGSLERDAVRRIRVRERNAFVSVHKADLERAIAALTGLTVGDKSTVAEQARERSGASGADDAV